MQFEYLTIADAVSNGPDGKLNVLGLGVRIANVESLPADTPMTILGAVAASVDEAGTYEVEVSISAPDGSREVIAHGTAELSATLADPRVPTGLTFSIPGVRSFRIEGVHTLEARVGELTRTYELLVRVQDPVTGAPERRTRAPRRRREAAVA